MEQFLTIETLVIELLLIVSVVAIIVQRLRIPYTVALVVVGLLITFQNQLELDLTPELILALFVPPLLFEAAFHIEFRRLRENLLPILALAIPGVLLSTFLVGGLVSWGVGIPLSSALVFGALISATDPVAVVALFRSLGAPKRLTTIVEGESLFNDGTAIVIFGIALAAAVPLAAGAHGAADMNGTAGDEGSVSALAAVLQFLTVALGGVGLGAGLGWIVSQLIARVDDYLIETTLTTVLAFGAYLLGERLHVSGVLAVVGAGIVCGNLGPHGMSPTTRIVLFNFWEYLAFVANSLVFLLIGLDVNVRQIIAYLPQISIAVGALLLSRALVIYGLTGLVNLYQRRSPQFSAVPRSYQHILFWGGLRGAISLALVLSLPAAFEDRGLLQVMTFGVVLFTLLIQGTTMNTLLRRLKLIERAEDDLEYERRHGRLVAAHAAHERIQKLHAAGMIAATTWEKIAPELQQRIEEYSRSQSALLAQQPSLRHEEEEDARREGLRAQRTMLGTLFSEGILSERVYNELVTEVDAALQKHERHTAPEKVADPSGQILAATTGVSRDAAATDSTERAGD
jgi:CPA1 family monovalent cation:H+ antiporter